MTRPMVFRPRLDRDTARTITKIVQEKQRELLSLPVGMARDRLIERCQTFLDAMSEEAHRDTPARSKRETLEFYQREAAKAKVS